MTQHTIWPCEDDHARAGECESPDVCGCSCHGQTDLRHAQVDDIPVDVFLTDPGLALVHADMGAWMEAHPCVCPALCECEDR